MTVEIDTRLQGISDVHSHQESNLSQLRITAELRFIRIEGDGISGSLAVHKDQRNRLPELGFQIGRRIGIGRNTERVQNRFGR